MALGNLNSLAVSVVGKAESKLAAATGHRAPLTAPAAFPLHVPTLSQAAAPSCRVALNNGPVCCVVLTMRCETQ